MNRATFRFYGDLNYFRPKKIHDQSIIREFDWQGSIKDMIESLGVPHPEIDLIVVNNTSVDFEYIVQDGDEVHVYPYRHDSDVLSQVMLRPPLTEKPSFILDTHLGRLASYLRMAGFDTLYRNDYPDDELAQVSHDETRVLLTRDIGLLKRSLVTYGYFVRETKPRRRLVEVMVRYGLAAFTSEFARCASCNGVLHQVDKNDVMTELENGTASHYEIFHRCEDCQKLFWRGSHYEHLQQLLQEASDMAR